MEDLAEAVVSGRTVRGFARVAASCRRWALGLAIPALLLAPAASASAGAALPRRATGYAEAVEACPQSQPGFDRCFALVRKPVARPAAGATAPEVKPFVAGAGAALVGPAGGLTPEDLASAYGYTPTADGTGETVGIVDAFDDPSIASDLAEFDTHYGLPACTTENGCLRKVGQSGGSVPAADTSGWSVEIALDVETVHAACPNCHILLVESNNNSIANLATATNRAVALGASVVSNSYGGPESFEGASERSAYDHPGVPILASTGDDGYYNWLDSSTNLQQDAELQMANSPAALPSVISVGGTTLELNPNGTRASETAWDEAGGGCSKVFEAQQWQQNVAGFAFTGCGKKRLDADVSAVADPNTGLDIYDTYDCGAECEGLDEGWETIGGTSLAAPFISSLYALAGGGHGLPYPAVTLYGQAARFDVTEGGNGACEGEAFECKGINSLGFGRVDCEGTTECDAGAGYDGPTGVGTPEGLGLFEPESPSAAISAPDALTAGTGASFSVVGFNDPYPGGSVGSASWSWGDGSSSGGATAGHAYASPGTYTITLAVTDRYGVEAPLATKTVNVAQAPRGPEGGGGGGGTTPGNGNGNGSTGTTPSGSTGTTPAGGGSQGVAGFNAGATAKQPSARLASVSLKASAGKAKLEIVCAASGATCSGTVTLTMSAGHAAGARQKLVTLGSASFTIAAGKTESVVVRLSAKARALLAKGHGLKALATLQLHQASDTARPISSAVTIHAVVVTHRSR